MAAAWMSQLGEARLGAAAAPAASGGVESVGASWLRTNLGKTIFG